MSNRPSKQEIIEYMTLHNEDEVGVDNQWTFEDAEYHLLLSDKYYLSNGDLRIDLDKIQSYDDPITVSKAEDHNLDNPFAIDVEDSSYWYSTIEARDEDFVKLQNILN